MATGGVRGGRVGLACMPWGVCVCVCAQFMRIATGMQRKPQGRLFHLPDELQYV